MLSTLEIKKRESFKVFKATYPARNGRKLEMPLAEKKWLQYITPKDIPLILSATKEFANSREVKSGIGIMNAHRFIKDGKGIEHWRDWTPQATGTIKTTHSEPLTPERIKDIKNRFSPKFHRNLYLKVCGLWDRSKRLKQLKHCPDNMW